MVFMPLYSYQNPETGEIIEVLQRMNDEHVYSENGVDFPRVWHIPQLNQAISVDAYSVEQFHKSNEGKNYTLGDVWDKSNELSEKRASKDGKDPVREKFYDKWSKEHGGSLHPNKKKAQTKEKLKKLGVTLHD